MHPTDRWTYVVTDVECDGHVPGANSMRSLASVATTAGGTMVGTFEAVLEPLPGAQPDPGALAWFATQPGAWETATDSPRPVADCLTDLVRWVRALPRPRIFAASPLAFDGGWVDYYLRRFTTDGLAQSPRHENPLFDAPGLCLRSYAAAVLGRPVGELTAESLPPGWLGDVPHSHRAIDDATGYAHLLRQLLASTPLSLPDQTT